MTNGVSISTAIQEEARRLSVLQHVARFAFARLVLAAVRAWRRGRVERRPDDDQTAAALHYRMRRRGCGCLGCADIRRRGAAAEANVQQGAERRIHQPSRRARNHFDFGHWHRCSGGTPRSASSIWRPQPNHVGFWHFEHCTRWHTRTSWTRHRLGRTSVHSSLTRCRDERKIACSSFVRSPFQNAATAASCPRPRR